MLRAPDRALRPVPPLDAPALVLHHTTTTHTHTHTHKPSLTHTSAAIVGAHACIADACVPACRMGGQGE